MRTEDMETQRFNAQQTEYARKVQEEAQNRATGILTPKVASAETEKSESVRLENLNPFDVIARLNAFIRFTAGVKCYLTLQNRVYVQISEVRPSSDGAYWHCTLTGEEGQKGTTITIPAGGPLLIRIDA